jgi:hypothetical protein
MGIGPTAINLLFALKDQGIVSNQESLVDFGSQEYDAKLEEYDGQLRKLASLSNSVLPETQDPETGRLKGPANQLYKAMNWNYCSFDIDGRFGAEVMDFNISNLDPKLKGAFSISCNFGTAEHVFNQYNFFKLQHEATKKGGLMIHILPIHNYLNHGFYNYSPVFFQSLAKYNDYEIIGLWKNSKPNFNQFTFPEVPVEGKRVLVVCVMRKNSDNEFKMPLQINEPMVLSPEAVKMYGQHQQIELKTINHNMKMPVSFYIDMTSGKMVSGIMKDAGKKYKELKAKKLNVKFKNDPTQMKDKKIKGRSDVDSNLNLRIKQKASKLWNYFSK